MRIPALIATLSLAASVAAADPVIGSARPTVAVVDRAGTPVNLDAGGAQVVIVDFFATWCGPCHEALATLTALCRESGTRVRLYIVDVGETAAQTDAFFATHPLPPNASVVFDPHGAAAVAWGQHRFPTTFFVGSDGVIRHINRGYGPGYPARVRRWVDMMLLVNAT